MRATVRLELRNDTGEIVEVRRAKNSVMKSGAELLANLFTGKAGKGITHMGVGTSGEAEEGTFVRAALTTSGDEPLGGGAQTEIAPADFTVKADAERRLIVVQVHATLPKTAAVGTLREAALLSQEVAPPPADPEAEPVAPVTKLYNRVTFAPIDKANDHELTMFWEVTFPYGDLNWL